MGRGVWELPTSNISVHTLQRMDYIISRIPTARSKIKKTPNLDPHLLFERNFSQNSKADDVAFENQRRRASSIPSEAINRAEFCTSSFQYFK